MTIKDNTVFWAEGGVSMEHNYDPLREETREALIISGVYFGLMMVAMLSYMLLSGMPLIGTTYSSMFIIVVGGICLFSLALLFGSEMLFFLVFRKAHAHLRRLRAAAEAGVAPVALPVPAVGAPLPVALPFTLRMRLGWGLPILCGSLWIVLVGVPGSLFLWIASHLGGLEILLWVPSWVVMYSFVLLAAPIFTLASVVGPYQS